MTMNIVDGRVQLNVGGRIIKQYFAEEIFTRSNLKPFVFISGTGGGKTFAACDVIRVCAASGFNQINYITSTFNSQENKYARDQILRACVVQKNYIQKLSDIIQEVLDAGEQGDNVDQLRITTESIMSQLEKDQVLRYKQSIIQKMRNTKYSLDFLQKRVCGNDVKGVEYLNLIFKQTDPFQFKQMLEQNKDVLESIIGDGLDDMIQFEDDEKTKRYILNNWHSQILKIFKKYEQEYVQICKDILRGKIKQIIQNNHNMLIDYQINGKLQNKELEKYIQYILDPRKLCLVIDDITHILSQSGVKGQKVKCDGLDMSEKDAFNSIFNKIFTQGRHLGTIMLGIHQTQNLDSKMVSLISNVIVNPTTNLGSNRNLFIMQNDKKQYVQNILDHLRISNKENDTFFSLVCFNDVEQSPDPESCYVLYQAKQLESGRFNFSLYQNAPYFYELAKVQMRKLYSTEADSLIQQQQKRLQLQEKSNDEYSESDENNESEYENESEESDGYDESS